MANCGAVTTRYRKIRPAEIEAAIADLNQRVFKNNLKVEPSADGKCWDISYVSGGETWTHRYCWLKTGRKFEISHGGGGWGSADNVRLDPDVEILLANNIDDSCAVWNAKHPDTSLDGDIGYAADQYPYSSATFMKAGEVHRIGILTPHESLPVKKTTDRQFLRILSSGVHGREPYFTENPLMRM